MTKRMRFYLNVFGSLAISFSLYMLTTPKHLVDYTYFIFLVAFIIFIYEAFHRPEEKNKKVKEDGMIQFLNSTILIETLLYNKAH